MRRREVLVLILGLINSFAVRRSSSALAKLDSELADSEMHLTKMDVVLSFQLEVSSIPAEIWLIFFFFNMRTKMIFWALKEKVVFFYNILK